MKTLKKVVPALVAVTILTGGGSIATATSASAATTYSCGNEYQTPNPIAGGSTFSEFGYYSGNDYVPGNGEFSYAAIEAQCLLNTLGYGLTVDGYYGPNTQNAVRNLQTTYQIYPMDGFLGPITWPHLREVAR
ncbi:peptidoglycan-binding protein [Kitasatospora sp. NPDC004669]|uniref:peptidoglycan-binding domain-containing protein n=1 Tax=Kitasatospora sp. NPDC004669 TaxID=3154555 RepID=UPI0033B36477